MAIDVMAFGAHPDDVELGAGGIMAALARKGLKTAIVDLTAGELATAGTPAVRRQEALAAAALLGVSVRECLGLPDGGVFFENSHLAPVIEVLRRYRPKLVLMPYGEDRHPDHERAHRLVREAVFQGGLTKVQPELGEAHRPVMAFSYFINTIVEPSLIVDVSETYGLKEQALAAYGSQFFRGDLDKAQNLGVGDHLALIESRDRRFGLQIGVRYGEGLVFRGPLPLRGFGLEAWLG